MPVVTTITKVEAVDLRCGHRIYLAEDFIVDRQRDHKRFYCNVCGAYAWWPQKSDIEKLRGQLSSTKDMLNTARAQRDRAREERDHKERQRRAEKAAKTRLRNRITKGVCPCCNRTFENLARHMATKHPDYND